MDINEARVEIEKLVDAPKYDAMINTAAIITKLLEKDNIHPIVVGGLSVEIYTQSDYTTRDIDFVSDGYMKIADLLFKLGFEKEDRHFYHEKVEIAIEIPDNYLAGDYNRDIKLAIDDDKYVYVISIEDIIMDRLRASVHWRSSEDKIWGFKLLANNYERVDLTYMRQSVETKLEEIELENWISQIEE
ncbi:DUF6036 family nucleotidyltransferase [Ammoniphilus resinae]|uniref:DUF6036 domain-containing protein n=1 Tax=Ammoniphilus resinae TaxID=861532 RepID=A0ABS4GX30_9BACL|nr:DUF6036 family nucleotidyltransferase [Ammoniphilus resinae]MBP1934824.1 hypothetical protein [Ammoniphilus resinae]